ncbi:hypothetical protein DMX11_08090 [Pseudomonas sp. LB-090624]|uniref:hypothetical protein n=1 Tax=Pseudomonas sp. LB-090624 TaxID=2213079 RepID=UPI000D824C2E|nr:hypothetical protein [Pseudomonas sp. LB-090624]PYB78888.1 hypothetical protein DMX11_08090 [Pseudomonas sp. LB-090624]
MSVEELTVLVEQLQGRSIARCEYETEQESVVLVFASYSRTPVVDAVQLPVPGHQDTLVEAPKAGRFLSSHPLQGVALAAVGEPVEAGAIIGFIQVGESLQPVKVKAAGVMAGYCPVDGELVGYGSPIAWLVPS